ncbi:MAG: hypothetical protein MUQ30_12485 [Anaerolineae bacterium]|nr:hypothetical protein [Anaerolineae bacterium]
MTKRTGFLDLSDKLLGSLAEWAPVIVRKANADILRGRDDKKGIVC